MWGLAQAMSCGHAVGGCAVHGDMRLWGHAECEEVGGGTTPGAAYQTYLSKGKHSKVIHYLSYNVIVIHPNQITPNCVQ